MAIVKQSELDRLNRLNLRDVQMQYTLKNGVFKLEQVPTNKPRPFTSWFRFGKAPLKPE